MEQDIPDRTARALNAAVAAGRDLGLDVSEATVLHELFSVVVHLAPAPVVVRVPVVLPRSTGTAALAQRQRTELDVVGWLAEQGYPVIPPSPLVPAEPVQRDGFSMTFWRYTEILETVEPDYVRNAGLIADLHRALRDYPRELPFLSAAEPQMITDALDAPPDLLDPADADRARQEWKVLEPLVTSRAAFEAEFGVDLQPIHGDAPPFNLVPTPDGELYADFELVTLGPVEWDLAAFGPECEASYDSRAREVGVRELDERVLRFVNAVGALRTISCLALVPQLPMLADALTPAIDQWRTTPFAGGLSG